MTHAHRSATPVSTHDTTRIDDTRIKAVRPLITPALLQEWLPPTEAALALVESSRAAISRVLHGQDDRLVVVVGPCSIHDHAQAMEYAHALKVQADALQDDLLVVMRVYFEKPRTTVGWKGLIMDPDLDGTCNIPDGLRLARRILRDVIDLGPIPAGIRLDDVLITISTGMTASVTGKLGFAYADGVDRTDVPQNDAYFGTGYALSAAAVLRKTATTAPIRLPKEARLILTTGGAANAKASQIDVRIAGELTGPR